MRPLETINVKRIDDFLIAVDAATAEVGDEFTPLDMIKRVEGAMEINIHGDDFHTTAQLVPVGRAGEVAALLDEFADEERDLWADQDKDGVRDPHAMEKSARKWAEEFRRYIE